MKSRFRWRGTALTQATLADPRTELSDARRESVPLRRSCFRLGHARQPLTEDPLRGVSGFELGLDLILEGLRAMRAGEHH
jgi:hypothetical protein